MDGWISIHRKVKDHWIFKENQKKVFSKFEAWIDLLLIVNHKEIKFLMGGELEEVKRGSTITSLRKLSDNWNWSITKTKKFLDLLENDKMITYKSNTKRTVITIENYDKYQKLENGKVTKKEHESNTEVTQKENEKKQTIMSNKENNDKNVNNKTYMGVIEEYTNNKMLKETINDFVVMRKKDKKFTIKALELNLIKLNKLTNIDSEKIEIINQSIMNSWKGFFELKKEKLNNNKKHEDESYATRYLRENGELKDFFKTTEKECEEGVIIID